MGVCACACPAAAAEGVGKQTVAFSLFCLIFVVVGLIKAVLESERTEQQQPGLVYAWCEFRLLKRGGLRKRL